MVDLSRKMRQRKLYESNLLPLASYFYFYREFDPGSGRTLAACLTHASRTELSKTLCVLQLTINNEQLRMELELFQVGVLIEKNTGCNRLGVTTYSWHNCQLSIVNCQLSCQHCVLGMT